MLGNVFAFLEYTKEKRTMYTEFLYTDVEILASVKVLSLTCRNEPQYFEFVQASEFVKLFFKKVFMFFMNKI